nr:immunoglobulin heavy chain junction region [Macaca mulatta]
CAKEDATWTDFDSW